MGTLTEVVNTRTGTVWASGHLTVQGPVRSLTADRGELLIRSALDRRA
jgi:hypothetical protein